VTVKSAYRQKMKFGVWWGCFLVRGGGLDFCCVFGVKGGCVHVHLVVLCPTSMN
jgi:hypothetical protein